MIPSLMSVLATGKGQEWLLEGQERLHRDFRDLPDKVGTGGLSEKPDLGKGVFKSPDLGERLPEPPALDWRKVVGTGGLAEKPDDILLGKDGFKRSDPGERLPEPPALDWRKVVGTGGLAKKPDDLLITINSKGFEEDLSKAAHGGGMLRPSEVPGAADEAASEAMRRLGRHVTDLVRPAIERLEAEYEDSGAVRDDDGLAIE